MALQKMFLTAMIIWLSSCGKTIAQTTKVTELLAQLEQAKTDTAQMSVMRKLSAAYSSVNPVKKFFYANQYRLLAQKNNIDSLVSDGYQDMGISLALRSNLDSALHFFLLANQQAKACNYLTGIARSNLNVGYTYDRLDRKREAVKRYEESLTIFKKLNHKKGINQCITNLGSLYFDLREYKIADQYFRQVAENLKETPHDKLSWGKAYYTLGGSSRKLGHWKKAMYYYQKSLALATEIGDLNGIGLSNWGIGQLLVEKKQFKKSFVNLDVALKNNRLLKNIYQECAVLMTVAEAYLGLQDYQKAEENAYSALTKSKDTDSKISVSLALKLLERIKAAQKKYGDALHFKKAYVAVDDSLDNNNTSQDVIRNDLQRVNNDYQNLAKDNKSISLKNNEYLQTIVIITGLLAMVIFLAGVYYKRNQEKKAINTQLQKQKQEMADMNEELGALNEELTSQMDIVSAQNIELEKLNNIKNKFFSIVSHDLRGPINTLKALFGLYRNGALDEKELSEILEKLEDTIYSTANFLDNLLEWSKSQLDGMVVIPTVVDLHQIVEENIKLMDSQIKLKQLKVENHIDAKLTSFADKNMINVVFRNLLSNAIKFCNQGDEISFNATKKDKNIIYTIKDTGPGINDRDKENLFNLTHTISTGTAGEKGHHIGLILCRDMVLQNRGSFEVHSQQGEGTTFSVSLPFEG